MMRRLAVKYLSIVDTFPRENTKIARPAALAVMLWSRP